MLKLFQHFDTQGNLVGYHVAHLLALLRIASRHREEFPNTRKQRGSQSAASLLLGTNSKKINRHRQSAIGISEVGRSSPRCVISPRMTQRAHCRRYARQSRWTAGPSKADQNG